jgi:Magnesium transporter NIPA
VRWGSAMHVPHDQNMLLAYSFASSMAPHGVTCFAHAAGFLTYAASALAVVVMLIWGAPPEWGTTNVFVYLGICSLMGSLSVVSCKVLGIAAVSAPLDLPFLTEMADAQQLYLAISHDVTNVLAFYRHWG